MIKSNRYPNTFSEESSHHIKNANSDYERKYLKILKTLDIKPNLKLGQIFLINERIVEEQICHANLSKQDRVLEIGPGLGILTTKLAARVNKVYAIEYDNRLYSYLKKIVPGNVELILGDAVSMEFPKFNKLVSNIPYQISSPLIFKLINYPLDLAVLMLQAEFANRLIASKNTKDYSRLTVMSSYYFDVEQLFEVPKTNFVPVPKINSAVVKILPKKGRKIATDEKLFARLVRIVFSERRKMMKNSILNNAYRFNISKTQLKEILANLPFTDCRPEQLALEQFIELADKFHTTISNRKLQ